MRCVPIRPLVLAPQTKNVPARIQNARDRIAVPQRRERRERARRGAGRRPARWP